VIDCLSLGLEAIFDVPVELLLEKLALPLEKTKDDQAEHCADWIHIGEQCSNDDDIGVLDAREKYHGDDGDES